MFKKIAMFYSVAVTAAVIGFFGGKITTENRLVGQHRQQLELARQRTAVLSDTLERARTEVGEIGASLDRQRTSIADLRELIGEIKTRYEKMEELLYSAGLNDCDTGSINNSTSNDTGGEISNEKRERLQEQAQAPGKVH